jgi:acetyltransferase-like isoleucine patch superfamily enzyme
MIFAGGRGERMSVLSYGRAKPSLSFAGSFRVIDFVLTNCVYSEIGDIAVVGKGVTIPSHTAMCSGCTILPDVEPGNFVKHVVHAGTVVAHYSAHLANVGAVANQTA